MENAKKLFEAGNFAHVRKLFEAGDFIRAKELSSEALKENPENAQAQLVLGKCLIEMKDFQAALFYLEKANEALKTPETEGELGLCYYLLKDYENAHIHLISSIIENYEDKYAKALEKTLLCRHNDEAMLGLKLLMFENHQNDIFLLRDITTISQKIKKFDIAIEYFKLLLAKCPKDFVAWNNLGLIYEETTEWARAFNCYKKALSIKDFFSPNFNLGILTRKMHRFKESVAFLKKAAAQNPKSPQPRYSLAMSYMMLKDFKNGYPLYAKHMSIIMPYYYRNEWDGVPHPDKTLCVFTTGGLGDMLMFARYFEYLKGKFKEVYILAPVSLHAVLKRSYPEFTYVDSKDIFTNFDYAITPMHILKLFDLDFNWYVPQTDGYLRADDTKAEKFRKKFFSNKKLKIAINWHGNREGTRTFFNRSMPLENFEPIFEKFKEKAVFYSIQKDESRADCAKYPHVIDLYDEINDFDDTAAILKNVDLLISIDSSPVHIAGATGVKTFVLLPYANEWRWFIDEDKSVWYESVSLFRQDKEGDWQSALKKMYAKIEELLEE